MILSEIVAYRNLLLEYNVKDAEFKARQALTDVMHTVKNSVIQPRTFTQTLEEDMENIFKVFGQFDSTLNELINELNAMIEVWEKSLYAESSRRFKVESSEYNTHDKETKLDVDQHLLAQELVMSPDTKKMLTDRLKSFIDWKYPGLIIRPGKETFINDFVGLDPLYLVDYSSALLEPCTEKFTDEYKKRLRMYVEPPASTDVLWSIPDDQFGVCLVYNFFEFTPLEVIEQYLKKIFKKLRPGGILSMTFNDCDRAHCVILAEKRFSFYTPGHQVRAAARRIGFKQEFTWHDNGNLTWLELRKPGELVSNRGGQTLAKIMPNKVANSK
jgi:hypothetical protein